MSKCDHYCWDTMLQVSKDVHPSYKKMSPKEAYRVIRRHFQEDPPPVNEQTLNASLISTLAEEEWYALGKPYYKVWPQIARHLMQTNIDISGSYLHFPFHTFEIRLPKRDPIYERPDRPVRAILAHCFDKGFDGAPLEHPDGRDWTIFMTYQFGVEKPGKPHNWASWWYVMGVFKDRVIATYTADDFNPAADSGGYTPSRTFTASLFKLLISTCFFGIHAHDLVCPDIPARYIDRWHQARKNRDKSEAEKLLERAKEMGHFGWKIGSEIDLPSAEIRHHTLDTPTQPGSGRELTAGHLRSGHLRLQPYGPRDEPTRHELIFVQPTVVRPDLPLRDVRGFRIRDDALT